MENVAFHDMCDIPIYICFCSGIVRGVDIRNDLLYVITPVACQDLEKVDLLLQGFIEIPTGFLQVFPQSYYLFLTWKKPRGGGGGSWWFHS